jgi:hypothetical protein
MPYNANKNNLSNYVKTQERTKTNLVSKQDKTNYFFKIDKQNYIYLFNSTYSSYEKEYHLPLNIFCEKD